MSNKGLSKNRNQNQQVQAGLIAAQTVHIGPLPSPEVLEKYNTIIPDGANRIMTMAEKQQDHRFGLENTALRSQLRQSKRGQIFGFIICLVGLGISAWAIGTGHELGGSILGGGGLLGLVSVFIYGKQRQEKSIEQKNRNSQRI